ncbi:RfaG Glycosyltransferase [Methylophilaceae bacterium]
MKILFIHQNFPGQFKHIAPIIAKDPKNQVVAITARTFESNQWNNIQINTYSHIRAPATNLNPWLINLESQVNQGQAVLQIAKAMRESGFYPDIIIAHPAWGESFFIKDVWPNAHLSIYCEMYYQTEGGDVNFDLEWHIEDKEANSRLRLRNAFYELQSASINSALSPTSWQANTFPKHFRDRITVIHDGIDTEKITPDPFVKIDIKNQQGEIIKLSKDDEVVTFISRNLEPYRGIHIFIRALPELLKKRPKLRVLMIGGNDVSYGYKHPSGKKWRDIFMNEILPKIGNEEKERIHFIDPVPHPQLINILQLSSVHVYLTYPFVLSWSLIEAMSAGCAIVASDTAPVMEVIEDRKNGLLVNFFDHAGLTKKIISLLENPKERKKLGNAARNFAKKNYDLHKISLPKQIAWINSLLK